MAPAAPTTSKLPQPSSLLRWPAAGELIAPTGAVDISPPFHKVIGTLWTVLASPEFHKALGMTAEAWGIGLGCAQPMIMALLYAASPPGRQGEVVGVRTMMLSTSSTLLPLVFGALGAALGMAPVFLAMAAGMLGAGWPARVR